MKDIVISFTVNNRKKVEYAVCNLNNRFNSVLFQYSKAEFKTTIEVTMYEHSGISAYLLLSTLSKYFNITNMNIRFE